MSSTESILFKSLHTVPLRIFSAHLESELLVWADKFDTCNKTHNTQPNSCYSFTHTLTFLTFSLHASRHDTLLYTTRRQSRNH